MPNVADLLKQTAGAPGGKSANPASPSSPSQASLAQNSPSQTAAATQPSNPPLPNSGPASPEQASKPGAPPDLTGSEPPAVQPSSSGTPATSDTSAPFVSHGSPPPQAPAPGGSPSSPSRDKLAAPQLADRESKLGSQASATPAASGGTQPAGGGKLTLPTTALEAAPGQKPAGDGTGAAAPQSPAQQKMEDAVAAQRELLAEFARVSDRLNNVLGSLEASTFVKRFKAAARQQMSLATRVSQQTLSSFGLPRQPTAAAAPLARQAQEQSDTVHVIESDLDAYSQRKQDARYKRILDEMRKTEVVQGLARDGERLTANLSGESLNGAEYWADTLDRWSEELVAATQAGEQSKGPAKSQDSLSPEIVLKVIEALRDEMQLRDQTRELENVRRAFEPDRFTHDAHGLSERQGEIGTHVRGAADEIRALPEGDAKFSKELKLLGAVGGVMDESRELLAKPETGAPSVAAETEAIELLLQAKRDPPPGGGGGGGTQPGHGATAESTTMGALAQLGPGSDPGSTPTVRPVEQATGHAGKEFPDEFKTGLDTYFNLLEGSVAPQ
jgi:hypothetical protein